MPMSPVGGGDGKMYHYRESGLSNVWLVNGFDWVETPYGKAVRIRNPDGLQRTIAEAIAAKPGELSGEEFRFLRKTMNLSQHVLAGMLGHEEQTVAIWAKRRGPPLG